VCAALGAVLAGSTALRLFFAVAGLAVPVGIQAALHARQRRLAGDLQRGRSSFRTLVESSVDPVVILDDRLRVTFASESAAELVAPGFDPDLAELSLTDPVTGLPDRAALVRRLGAVQRQAGRPFALALVGVEGLASEVLTPEAEAGVLRELTARLTRALRGEDWPARGKDGDVVVLTLLRDMGHRYLQGYVFSRPLEAEQLADGAWETWVELPGTVSSTNADVPAQSPAMPS
jgi:GGDEF domain-containing protein